MKDNNDDMQSVFEEPKDELPQDMEPMEESNDEPIKDSESDQSAQETSSTEMESTEKSEIKEKAKQYGHLSYDEWVKRGNDPKKYKSEQEYVRTGEILEQLFELKKKLGQRDREIEALLEY